MPVYPVNSERPSFISGVYTNSYIVKNSGRDTVYLGQDSSLSVATRSFSLPSGSTLNWEGKTELWAITSDGTVGELEILYDSNNSFTPGPDVVGVRNDSDTLWAFSVNSNPHIVLDVSDYESLTIRVEALNPSAFSLNTLVIAIDWFSNGQFIEESIGYKNGFSTWTIPIKNNDPTIDVFIGSPVNHAVYITGHRRKLSEYYVTYHERAIPALWPVQGVTINDSNTVSGASYQRNAYMRLTSITQNAYVLLPGILGEVDITYYPFGMPAGTTGDFILGFLPEEIGNLRLRRTVGNPPTTDPAIVNERILTPRAPLIWKWLSPTPDPAVSFRMNLTYRSF